MKKRMLCALLAIVMLLSMMPATAQAAEKAVNVSVFGVNHYTYAAEVVELVNTTRSENGAAALSRNMTLSNMAMERAAEIALYFSHTRPDGTGCDTIAEGRYTGSTVYGENIAIGQGTPESVMESWMNSEGHRANILDTEYTQIGVGCFYADGVYCWVQIFGNSTTDTDTVDATGAMETCSSFDILPSNLDLNPSGEMDLELAVGETATLSITSTNPLFSSISPTLIASVHNAYSSEGGQIASCGCTDEGVVTITGEASGSGVLEVPVYTGQSDALQVNLTITDTEDPDPSEPDPSEPNPDDTTYSISWWCNSGALGYIELSAEEAAAGETVYVYVTPNENVSITYVRLFHSASGGMEELSPESAGDTWVYSFVMPAQDVEIEVGLAKSSGNGSHSIEVYSNEGGSYTLSSTTAKAGEEVILGVYPDEGYWIDQILYLRADGNADLEYGSYGTNELYFIMPDCDLYLEIYFILSDSPFSDVKESAYYYEPVLWAVSNGITSGVSATRFGPNESCTRAQVVTFLWRAAGSPDPVSAVNPFSDVKQSDYYYKAVLWAVENGITSGISATRFGPGNVCTRAQVVTFLWRAVGSPEAPYDYNPFTDVPENAYYHDAVLFAVQYGITSGVSDTTFGSGSTCTRAHVVTFLYKTFHG